MKKIFTLFACLLVGILTAQNLQQGLVLHYPLEGNLTDAISGETADNNGGLTFEAGKVGAQAVRFTAQEAYFLTPDSALQVGPAVDGGTAGTFAMFVNHSAAALLTDRQNYIAQKRGCGPDDNNRGRVDLYLQSPTNTSGDANRIISFMGGQAIKTPYILDMADTWIHLTLTINPENMEWAFYVDGVELERNQMPGQAENSCGEYVIGHHLTFTTGTQTFDGLMDDLRFYNRVLTPEEITLLANQDGTSTKEEIVADAIKLAPNPVAADQPVNFAIDNSVFRPGSSIVLNVIDATGRRVLERKYNGVTDQLTLHHGLIPGFYNVTLTDGERLATMKLVVL